MKKRNMKYLRRCNQQRQIMKRLSAAGGSGMACGMKWRMKTAASMKQRK